MVSFLGGDDGRVGHQREVNTGIGHQVSLKFDLSVMDRIFRAQKNNIFVGLRPQEKLGLKS